MSEINQEFQSVKRLVESTIKRLYEANNSVLAIATKTGLSEREVRHIAHKLGLIIKQQYRITDEELEMVRDCVDAGMSGHEIAEEVGMPLQRVQYIVYERLGLSITRKAPSTNPAVMAKQKPHYSAPKPKCGQLIPNYQTETIEVAT